MRDRVNILNILVKTVEFYDWMPVSMILSECYTSSTRIYEIY